MKNKKEELVIKRRFAVLAGASFASMDGAVLAQDYDQPSEASADTIVVTATKRGEANLQDVPFAVQAITGDSLKERGALDFDDYFRFVPGLAVFDQGPGDKRYIVRGVNSVGAGTVGLYLDEAIITGENAQDGGGRQADIKLFDIERVEVLKGPQGTTFGSSSLSGTIRYISNKPDVSEFGGGSAGDVRHVKGAGLGGSADLFVNIPVAEDVAALRVAGFYENIDGYIDNILDEGVNAQESLAYRASLLIQPSDNFDITFMAMYQKSESDGSPYYNLRDYAGNAISQGEQLFQADVTQNGFEDEFQVYNATANLDTGYGVITATASLFDRDTVFNRDSSRALEAFAGLDPLGAGRSIITQPKQREVQSYELRYASDFDGPLQVLIGIFYQDEERFFRSAILSASNGAIDANPMSFLDRNVSTDIQELAFFGELSLDITDRLNITGGLRRYDFEINEVAEATTGFGGGPGDGVGPQLSSSEDGMIFKANIAWDVTGDISAYFQVAEGFRSGGANDQTAAAIAGVTIPEGFGSDSLINYELGVKSQFPGITANAAVYSLDWSDIQIQDQATDGNLTFPFRSNGGGADVIGAEFELYAQPAQGLNLGLTANVLSAQLSEDNPLPASGMDGDEIPYVPDFTLSATAEYEWPVSSGSSSANAFFGGDVNYVSERNTEIRPDNAFFVNLDGYALVGLRAGLRGDSWSVILSANNLLDDDTVIDIFRVIPGVYPDGFIRNTPRSVVLRVTKGF